MARGLSKRPADLEELTGDTIDSVVLVAEGLNKIFDDLNLGNMEYLRTKTRKKMKQVENYMRDNRETYSLSELHYVQDMFQDIDTILYSVLKIKNSVKEAILMYEQLMEFEKF